VLTRAATDLYAAKDYPRAIGGCADPFGAPAARRSGEAAHGLDGDRQFRISIREFDKAEAGYNSAQALMPAERSGAAVIVERWRRRFTSRVSRRANPATAPARSMISCACRIGADLEGARQRGFRRGRAAHHQKQWDRAIVVLEGFRRNFPQSPLQADVTRNLAVAYSESNRPGQAAVEFEQIAQNPANRPTCSAKPRCRRRISTTRRVTAQSRKAMLEAFVKHFPQPLNPAMEARNKLSLIAAKAGDFAARDFWLRTSSPPTAPRARHAPTAAGRWPQRRL
jgi:hypothetical protein